jgi:Protein of unknown function (DUF1499)
MTGPLTPIQQPLARWSSRLALFAITIIAVVLPLHRFTQFPTKTAMALVGFAFALAAIAFLVGFIAAISIWRRGRTGAWSAAVGMILPLALFTWPLAMVPAYQSLPVINDISTDTATPPRFDVLAKERHAQGANTAAYPGERFAKQQAEAYPDLRTATVNRPVEDTYDLVLDIVRGRRGLRWKVVAEVTPTLRPARFGLIEVADRSLILGFVDDVVIRVSGNETQSKVDIRSASRFGMHDFGQNASRIRRFLRELQSRLDSINPGVAAGASRASTLRAAAGRADIPEPKRPGRRPASQAQEASKEGSKSGRAPSQTDAPRAPLRKEPPR